MRSKKRQSSHKRNSNDRRPKSSHKRDLHRLTNETEELSSHNRNHEFHRLTNKSRGTNRLTNEVISLEYQCWGTLYFICFSRRRPWPRNWPNPNRYPRPSACRRRRRATSRRSWHFLRSCDDASRLRRRLRHPRRRRPRHLRHRLRLLHR